MSPKFYVLSFASFSIYWVSYLFLQSVSIVYVSKAGHDRMTLQCEDIEEGRITWRMKEFLIFSGKLSNISVQHLIKLNSQKLVEADSSSAVQVKGSTMQMTTAGGQALLSADSGSVGIPILSLSVTLETHTLLNSKASYNC